MTKTARVYGGSLYDLAAEEKLDGQIMEQMIAVRQIFRENPGYLKLLGEPRLCEIVVRAFDPEGREDKTS